MTALHLLTDSCHVIVALLGFKPVGGGDFEPCKYTH